MPLVDRQDRDGASVPAGGAAGSDAAPAGEGRPERDRPGSRLATAGKQALTALGLAALAGSALFGANAFGVRERFLGSETPLSRRPAASRSAQPPSQTPARREESSVLRSQPWWQEVTTLEGVGASTTSPFTIDEGAIQWRLHWTCSTGRMVVRVPGRPKPLVDTTCPGGNVAYSTRTGVTQLEVTTGGRWQVKVDQQVDVPLVEPPLPEMAAPGARAVARGSFYRMDQFGNGAVTVYRLADGRHALRLDSFYVSPNVDLEIRFSVLDAPTTTAEYMAAAASDKVAPLDITAGAMNFVVPAEIDPRNYRSVVIWCPLIDSAYAAATLEWGE